MDAFLYNRDIFLEPSPPLNRGLNPAQQQRIQAGISILDIFAMVGRYRLTL